jgi:3-isopropylmalate dehydrogenase
MHNYRIAVLPGDGIGGEVMAEGIRVLRAVESKLSGVSFELEEFSVGAGEFLRSGNPLPPATFDRIQQLDAILLGAIGLPDVRWPGGQEMAPQLDLRERLELYCGLRPIRLYHPNDSPLKSPGKIDFAIIRENTEGLFSSRLESYNPDACEVTDRLRITRKGSERVFRSAFRRAARRKRLVTLVDKANVLPSMSFFRRIFYQIAAEFPGIRAEHVYVDAASLYLVQRPDSFDVIVTENMFGDILSDLAAAIVGGMGMAPSADIGDKHAVFQPSHGSAPDIAGQGIANPVAMILSVAMMLEWLGNAETLCGAARIRHGVEHVLADPGARTKSDHCGNGPANRVGGSGMRGGIVGCDYFARFHLEAWRRLPDAEIVAAADPDLRRARQAAPYAYASAEEMFDREQLDFVDIATRPDTHLGLVSLAAERRVPVICQKPMASNWAEAVAMVEAAATSTPFMIHENWRWQPWCRIVHARIAQADIGRPVSYAMRTRKADGAGTEPYSQHS